MTYYGGKEVAAPCRAARNTTTMRVEESRDTK